MEGTNLRKCRFGFLHLWERSTNKNYQIEIGVDRKRKPFFKNKNARLIYFKAFCKEGGNIFINEPSFLLYSIISTLFNLVIAYYIFQFLNIQKYNFSFVPGNKLFVFKIT